MKILGGGFFFGIEGGFFRNPPGGGGQHSTKSCRTHMGEVKILTSFFASPIWGGIFLGAPQARPKMGDFEQKRQFFDVFRRFW